MIEPGLQSLQKSPISNFSLLISLRMAYKSEAMGDAEVFTEFGQLYTTKLVVIVHDQDPREAKAVDDELSNKILQSNLCYLSEWFSSIHFMK